MDSVESVREDRQSVSETFARRTVRMFVFGLVGIIGLGVTLYLQATTGIPTGGLSPTLFAVLSLIQPTILLAVAALIGTWAAPRVGLTSFVHERGFTREVLTSVQSQVLRAVVFGLGVGVLLVVLDFVFLSFVTPELSAVSNQSSADILTLTLASIPARFLYGGITEEILLRWGLLSLLAWLGWRLTGQQDTPRDGIMWTAILLAAFVFGLGHLPATAAQLPLTPAIVIRTVLLNAIGGIVFGWLYWTDSLEASMIAHGSAHVILLGAALLTI